MEPYCNIMCEKTDQFPRKPMKYNREGRFKFVLFSSACYCLYCCVFHVQSLYGNLEELKQIKADKSHLELQVRDVRTG